MKLLNVLILVVAFACVAYSWDQTATVSLVNQKNTWEATSYPQFERMTIEEARQMMGFKRDAKLREQLQIKPQSYASLSNVKATPPSFDARKQWPACIHRILDQGNCGSCWAFGATESLSDRFCIASNGSQNFILSVQELVSCDLEGVEGCGGGDPVTAFLYTATEGLVLDSCVPYTSGKTGETGWCPSACTNTSERWVSHYSKLDSLRWHDEVESIQTAIMTNGPVEACFDVYEDFMNYKSGVYAYTTGAYLGGHCIKLVGWGVEATTNKPYWIAANSWGVSWGLAGFFWIQRGVDMCGIESDVFDTAPAV